MQSTATRASSRSWSGVAAVLLNMLLLVLVLNAVTAANNSERRVPLRTQDVTLRAGSYNVGGARYAALRIERNLRQAEQEALAASGVRLVSYLGDGTYIARIEPDALTTDVTSAYGIEAAAAWKPENKATPAVRQSNVDAWAKTDTGLIKLAVLFFQDVSARDIETILERHVETYRPENPPRLWAVEIEPFKIPELLQEQGIHVVEPGPAPHQPLLENARALIHANEVQLAVPSWSPPAIGYDGLTGRGVTLQVSEYVWDGHPDFTDENGQSRFLNPSPNYGVEHGTHVAGIMAGAGLHSAFMEDTPYFAAPGTWRGIAPEATLYDDEYYGGNGPLIDASNHSYIMNYDGTYDSNVTSVDQDVHGDNGRELRWPHIWAAANNGDKAEHGSNEGYYSILAPAKNIVTVGSVNSFDGSLSYFSSLGPTFDGRIKPDVMAPGGNEVLPPNFDATKDLIALTIDIYASSTSGLAWLTSPGNSIRMAILRAGSSPDQSTTLSTRPSQAANSWPSSV